MRTFIAYKKETPQRIGARDALLLFAPGKDINSEGQTRKIKRVGEVFSQKHNFT